MATQVVLAHLLDDPAVPVFGTEITKQTGIRSGSLYPILQRLEDAGWLVSRWEDAALAAATGRPPRRYYRLTADGEAGARTQISRNTGGVLDRLLRTAQPHAPGPAS